VPSKPAPLATGIGRPPKHAGRLLTRVLKRNELDRRTRVSKFLQKVADDLADDRGGWEHVTAAEEIAIRRAAFLTVLCGSIESWCLGHAEVIVDGELLGPLKKGLATHQANLIRTLSALGFRPDQAEKLPSLAEYIQSKASGGNGDPSSVSDSHEHDHVEGEARVRAAEDEAGKTPCARGCADCRCGELEDVAPPEVVAGGEDAA